MRRDDSDYLVGAVLMMKILLTRIILQEMYNNIVIYIVGHGTEDGMSSNEMHIFQCVNVSARDVVEDLKAFKQGRYR